MRTSGSGHWQHERRLIAILATLFSGKPCAWTARSGQTQKGTAHRRPLDTTRQSDRWRQLSVRSPVVGECCVGVRGRCAPTHGVDHPRALAGARSLPWLLTAGCRSRIARCGIVVIHDALIGVMFIGVAGHRIARCAVVVVQDPLIGVVLFAGHVWILWTVVGAFSPSSGAHNYKSRGDAHFEKRPSHFDLLAESILRQPVRALGRNRTAGAFVNNGDRCACVHLESVRRRTVCAVSAKPSHWCDGGDLRSGPHCRGVKPSLTSTS
jgi:hypothetical protein